MAETLPNPLLVVTILWCITYYFHNGEQDQEQHPPNSLQMPTLSPNKNSNLVCLTFQAGFRTENLRLRLDVSILDGKNRRGGLTN